MVYIRTNFTALFCTAFALAVWTTISTPAQQTHLDPAFGSGGRVIYSPTSGYDVVRRIRMQPDGKIVSFGGGSVAYSGSSFLIRHNSDGTLDTSFGSSGQVNTPTDFNQYFNDLVLLANGNLIITGNIPNIFATVATGFITYGPNGDRIVPGADASWDDAPGRRLLVQSDGKLVVVAGYGRPNYGTVDLVAIRYSGDGQHLDESFGNRSLANSNVSIWGIFEYWSHYGAEFVGDALIQPDGKILMTGYGSSGAKLVRLNSDGTFDTGFGDIGVASFSSKLYNHPTGIALQPDGKIVTNGVSAEFGLYSSFILRFNQNGSIDSSFGTNGSVTIPEPDPNSRGIGAALTIQPNGKIITAGERNGGFAMMRFNSNGTLDTRFGIDGLVTTQMGAASRAAILSLAWQTDGKLVAGGSVGDPASPTDIGLVRYRLNDLGIKVSGRVVSPNGSPLRNAIIALVDAQGGRRVTTTSSFGLFEFDNVTPNAAYTLSVSSKRYRFSPRTIQPTTDLLVADLVGLE